MSESTLTPGPWEARHNTFALWRVVRYSDGVTLWVGGCAMPTEADARVTAASPRLLSACRTALHYLENHVDHAAHDVQEEVAELRAAIEEATGKAE